ncbi:hypothetical protein B0H14DRAFT_2339717 [Mycena olivaceomarginata]|nr:hypothetical protein B0H14DRAFT_2339717 [Mycena olivaceomarginata]
MKVGSYSHSDNDIWTSWHIPTLEAVYNSAESFPQPRCHPQTRVKLLNDLHEWATSNEAVLPMRWLHGPAGAGKSAVMQTLCQRLEAEGALGGDLFFKLGHPTRGNANALFAALAYQLALYNPAFKLLISKILEKDPSNATRSLGPESPDH